MATAVESLFHELAVLWCLQLRAFFLWSHSIVWCLFWRQTSIKNLIKPPKKKGSRDCALWAFLMPSRHCSVSFLEWAFSYPHSIVWHLFEGKQTSEHHWFGDCNWELFYALVGFVALFSAFLETNKHQKSHKKPRKGAAIVLESFSYVPRGIARSLFGPALYYVLFMSGDTEQSSTDNIFGCWFPYCLSRN